jgi:hypothetical protein
VVAVGVDWNNNFVALKHVDARFLFAADGVSPNGVGESGNESVFFVISALRMVAARPPVEAGCALAKHPKRQGHA